MIEAGLLRSSGAKRSGPEKVVPVESDATVSLGCMSERGPNGLPRLVTPVSVKTIGFASLNSDTSGPVLKSDSPFTRIAMPASIESKFASNVMLSMSALDKENGIVSAACPPGAVGGNGCEKEKSFISMMVSALSGATVI